MISATAIPISQNFIPHPTQNKKKYFPFHQQIYSQNSDLKFWKQIKKAFSKPSLLANLVRQEIVWHQHCDLIKEAFHQLIIHGTVQQTKLYYDFRSILAKLTIEEIKVLIVDEVEYLFSEQNENYLKKCVDLLDERLLVELSGIAPETLADENVKAFPETEKAFVKKALIKELQKGGSILKGIISNLINIIILSFQQLSSSPRYIIESHAIIDTFLKILSIPSLIVVCLTPLLIPWQVYTVTVLILAATLTLLFCYQKWLRPIPRKLEGFINLSEKTQLDSYTEPFGREEEIREISSFLDTSNFSLIIKGPTGVGKTELVHKLSKTYKKKTFFYANTRDIVNYPLMNGGYSGLFQYLLRMLKGKNQRKVVLVLDEFQAAFDKNAGLIETLKTLIGDNGELQIIGITTDENYEKHIKNDQELCRRFRNKPFSLAPTSNEETEVILRHKEISKGVFLDDKVIEEIINCSEEIEGFQPNKAINFFDTVVSKFQQDKEKAYEQIKFQISKKNAELESIKKSYFQSFLGPKNSLDRQKCLNKINTLGSQIDQLEQAAEELKQVQENLAYLCHKQEDLRHEWMSLSNKIVQGSYNKEEKKLLLFYQTFAIPTLKKIIYHHLEHSGLPITLDEAFVRNQFNYYKKNLKNSQNETI